jgi:ribosome-associated translation inhibitor RaiA
MGMQNRQCKAQPIVLSATIRGKITNMPGAPAGFCRPTGLPIVAAAVVFPGLAARKFGIAAKGLQRTKAPRSRCRLERSDICCGTGMMEIPLEIAFHNIDASEQAESEIRSRVAELEKLYGRLNSCRVRVDQRAVNRSGTIPPMVRIELGIPGYKDVVVSHEPEHLQRKYQRPDIYNAIHEAFHVAERRLRDVKEQRKGRTREPQHDSENQSLGQVAELWPQNDHGFLMTKEGGLLYFHRNAMLSGDFDRLQGGDELYYVEDVGDTGPIACKVRVKAKP